MPTLQIPELDELEPPPWLPGEQPPARPVRDFSVVWYSPTGEPIRGDATEQARQYHAHRQQPENDRKTLIRLEGGNKIQVSTVYLGVDHGWFPEGGPAIIWETMIFGEVIEQYQWRYATRGAAMANHDRVVEIICRHTGAQPVEGDEGR